MSDTSLISERRLLAKLKKGSLIAFDGLFDHYSNRLFYFAYGYLKSEADAEEIVQEVFMKVWERRTFIKEELSFKSYLFTIAYNAIQKQFIKRNYQREYCNSLLLSADETDNITVEGINYNSLKELVDSLVNQLPPRRKEVYIKSRNEGLSTKEIAQEMNISIKTVENQLTQALKFLKENLAHENLYGVLFFALFLQ